MDYKKQRNISATAQLKHLRGGSVAIGGIYNAKDGNGYPCLSIFDAKGWEHFLLATNEDGTKPGKFLVLKDKRPGPQDF